MLALRSFLRTSPQLKNVTQVRNMSGIPIPARNKVSKGEFIVLATIMMSSWLVVPGWVLVNMKNYRNKE